MINLKDIHSLSEFQRNARQHIERLKQTGKAEVLTVNGEAQVVVQSPQSYQRLVNDAELARSLKVIRKSLEQVKAGKTRPMKAFLKELAARHEIDLQP